MTSESSAAASAADLGRSDARGDPFLDALWDYREDLSSVQDIVRLVDEYRGPCPHLLWDRDWRLREHSWRQETATAVLRYVDRCFDLLSEGKMADLVRALIDKDPNFPTIPSGPDLGGYSATFLYVALCRVDSKARSGSAAPHERSTALEVLKLLAPPGVTRLRSGRSLVTSCSYTPLHQACRTPGLDAAFVHHLLDLDAGVLELKDDAGFLPLHCAFRYWQPSGTSFISRMVQLWPPALLPTRSRDGTYINPAMDAFRNAPTCTAPATEAAVELLTTIALEHAEAIRPDLGLNDGTTHLMCACERFPDRRQLVGALVDAYPRALCVAVPSGRGPNPFRLPHDAVVDSQGDRFDASGRMTTLRLLEAETMHLVLASIEYVLGSVADDDGDAFRHPPVARFRREVEDLVATAFPTATAQVLEIEAVDGEGATPVSVSEQPDLSPRASSSGFDVAQALRQLEGGMETCGSVFRCSPTSVALRSDDTFQDAVLGGTVMGLYRMNRQGRSNPSPRHQVRLLASVSDDLDCFFRQFREIAAAHLVFPSLLMENDESQFHKSKIPAVVDADDKAATKGALPTRVRLYV
jgi:hypothetical protein